MRFTIERIRTLILAAGLLLVIALAAFLALARFKNPLNRRDIPKRLGIDIQQEANGVTYTQAHGGNTIFKIHASKVIQLKNNHAMLHDVRIELYGASGDSVDRIAGDEFDYDQKSGTATATGPVEITLMRPAAPAAQTEKTGARDAQARKQNAKQSQPAQAAAAAPSAKDEIHVKTSGLVFNQQTGLATTSQRADFSSVDGSGSSIGAAYNSNTGYLVLDSDVELDTQHGQAAVEIHAEHAEFDRNAQLCHLRGATAQTRGEQAAAAQAELQFRGDGSIERLNASGGMTLASGTGSRVAAPNGWLDFGEDNRPRRGALFGGVVMDSDSDGRTVHGTAPTMALEFTAQGDLRHMHLERGVEAHSLEQGQVTANGQLVPVVTTRTWRSPVADIDFREVRPGQIEPATMHGADGVTITGETRRGDGAPQPSRLAADEVTGVFASNSALSSMTGTGHASLQQTTPAGARESATCERLEARFVTASAPAPEGSARSSATAAGSSSAAAAASAPAQAGALAAGQVQSAVLDGHVFLLDQPAGKPGAQPQPPLQATAGHAVYDSAGQWLHLTVSPRIDNGGIELTAEKVDVTQQSGDAFARGDVKATWLGDSSGDGSAPGQAPHADAPALGGNGPAHAVAAEAQLHQSTGEAVFRGHARLWQLDNSVSAPVIVVDRQQQTLVARSSNPAEPVRAVLLSQPPSGRAATASPASFGRSGQSHSGSGTPSIIRVRGGELWYSGIERKAIMRAGTLGSVTAEGDGAQSTSDEVDLYLAPVGAPQPVQTAAAARAQPGAAQVDRMVAIGHVVLTSQSRRGTGQQLVYTSQSGNYVLTGSASAPPRMTDPEQGSVTGEALIFHSRDDSVSIEGGAQETVTETTAPR